MHEKLLATMAAAVSLSEANKQACIHAFEPITGTRNEVLEPAGRVPRYLYFVVSGYVRRCYLNDAGEEITTHINCPPGFITTHFNFVQQTPAQEQVMCLTDCSLLRISHPALQALLAQSEELQAFGTAVFQQSLAYNEQRANDLATLTARERYQKLITTHPDLLQHVPVQHLATFLGIKPESLSRIRRQIS